MENKAKEWEEYINRFMQRYNLYKIPLTDEKMLNKGFTSIISGVNEVFIIQGENMRHYSECKNLTDHEKEAIYKYVVWYCNNM